MSRTCPKSGLLSHKWLLDPDEYSISDTSMSFYLQLVCENCREIAYFSGDIMDWKQSERFKKAQPPGPAATEEDEEAGPGAQS